MSLHWSLFLLLTLNLTALSDPYTVLPTWIVSFCFSCSQKLLLATVAATKLKCLQPDNQTIRLAVYPWPASSNLTPPAVSVSVFGFCCWQLEIRQVDWSCYIKHIPKIKAAFCVTGCNLPHITVFRHFPYWDITTVKFDFQESIDSSAHSYPNALFRTIVALT